MSHDHHTLPRSTWALMLLLTLGWGCNWPMMKIALHEIPVWTFRSLCVWAGAIGVLLIARVRGHALLPPRTQWPRVFVTSLFNVTGWNILIGYGVTLLPAGRSAILAYTMPLWVALLSVPVLKEPLTSRRLLGLSLGMGGMLLLLIGTVLMKRFPTALASTSFTGWQLLLGGMPIIVGALLFDSGRLHALSWLAMLALAYNMIVAFILCHWIWFEIVSRASATVSSLGTLSIPVVGVFSSMVILGERPDWREYAALLLVLAAIATVLVPVRRKS